MGTSQSSKGPPSNVPMVPPWVPDPPLQSGDQNNDSEENDDSLDNNQAPQQTAPANPTPIPVAPAGRFAGARTNLNTFANSGDKNAMRRGVGHYVKKGYGGSGTAARRFAGTAATAGALYNGLSATARGEPSSPGSPLDPTLLSGRSAEEIIDAVVEAVSPTDGTQDSESHRAAIHDALSDLLERYEEADLLNLSDEERRFVIERFVARDVFRRFELDLGRTIQEKAPSVASALSRLKEINEYIRETVSGFFRDFNNSGKKINSQNINTTVNAALRETFLVFESYAS